jgi:hypothetical protein
MTNLNKKSIFTVLYLLFLVTGLSACRFGNYADPYKNFNGATFKSLDLYHTHAVGFETRVYLAVNPSDPNSAIISKTNSNTPLVYIPSDILSVFTDPVYFGVFTDKTLPQVFINISGDLSNPFQTLLGTDGKIDYASGYDPNGWYRLWRSPTCGTQMEDVHQGVFDNSRPDTYVFSDGTKSTIKGDLSFSIQTVRYFTGNCLSDFTELATCYLNGSGCSSSQLKAAITLFDLHVKAGLINLATDDLSKIKGLEYTVKYE